MKINKLTITLALAAAAFLTACGAKKEAAAPTAAAEAVTETAAAETTAAPETAADEPVTEAKAEETAESETKAEKEHKIKSDRYVKFPDFSAKTIDEEPVTNDIFLEKDLTVLNIWGTFCPPCIGEMPELGDWAREMPDNVQLIGLICDIAGDEDTEHINLAHEIIDKANVEYMNIVANEDFYPILAEVTGVPTTVFIDGDGNIVGHIIVGANVPGYKEYVAQLLND